MDQQMNGGLLVGYAKVDITPDEPQPMAGLGNSSQRKNQGILDPIFATCIAITDICGATALFYNLDIQNAYPPADRMRQAVSEAVRLPREQVMLCFNHDHSSVDINNPHEESVKRYNTWLTEKLVAAGKAALADRQDARMETAQVQTEGLNFVRRYIMNDGSLCGDNFGSTQSGFRCHETEADRQLQLVKFVRPGSRDVIVTNFQTHGNYTISTRMLSGDVASAFRTALERQSGCLVHHFNGASGNINPKSRIQSENIATDLQDWGRRLAEYAMKAEYTPKPVGKLKTAQYTFEAKANHSQDHLLPIAQQIVDVFYETDDRARCKEMGLPHGITSAYHALAIIGNAKREEPTIPVYIYVFSLGDTAFAFAPIEMFDTNGMYIKENSPFDMTFICGYANYCQGYMPSKLAGEHSGYEVLTSIFAPGNAEPLAEKYVQLLQELKN